MGDGMSEFFWSFGCVASGHSIVCTTEVGDDLSQHRSSATFVVFRLRSPISPVA